MDLALSMVFDSKLAVSRAFWMGSVESWASYRYGKRLLEISRFLPRRHPEARRKRHAYV